MPDKHQFTGTSNPRNFYDRKVITQGGTRTLSLGRIIPVNWGYVRIWIIKSTDKVLTLKIEKLLGTNKNET